MSSNPRWMMESDFEPFEYEYEDYKEDASYYKNHCDVCEGGSFINKIYIEYDDEYYSDDYDY